MHPNVTAYTTVLTGINEADGTERLDTLGVLVLQIFHLLVSVHGIHDVLFAHKSRRPASGPYVRRLERHVRVSAALCAVNNDILLRHLNVLFEGYAFRCVSFIYLIIHSFIHPFT